MVIPIKGTEDFMKKIEAYFDLHKSKIHLKYSNEF